MGKHCGITVANTALGFLLLWKLPCQSNLLLKMEHLEHRLGKINKQSRNKTKNLFAWENNEKIRRCSSCQIGQKVEENNLKRNGVYWKSGANTHRSPVKIFQGQVVSNYLKQKRLIFGGFYIFKWDSNVPKSSIDGP